jgi:hypothetical protein
MSDDSTDASGQPDADVSTDDLGLDEAEAQQLLSDAVQRGAGDTPDDDGTDWAAEAKKWRSLARKHEANAKANTRQAQTVEQQVEELRSQLAERDKRDEERNARLAMAKLDTQLAQAGIKREDVDGLLKRIKGTDLLADGEPDDAAIGELAGSLLKVAGRATPDPDQGLKGGKAPLDMNQLIRRAAGITT